MNSAYFTIHLGKNPPQNGCRLKSFLFNFFFKSTGFTSSTSPDRAPDFSQNQPAAITLNTGSPRTLSRSLPLSLGLSHCICVCVCVSLHTAAAAQTTCPVVESSSVYSSLVDSSSVCSLPVRAGRLSAVARCPRTTRAINGENRPLRW